MIRSARKCTWKQDCSHYFHGEEHRFVWSKLTFSERFIARSHSVAYLNSGWRTKWPQNATAQHWAGTDWSSLKEKNRTFSLFIFSQNKCCYLQNCRHRYIYDAKWRHSPVQPCQQMCLCLQNRAAPFSPTTLIVTKSLKNRNWTPLDANRGIAH